VSLEKKLFSELGKKAVGGGINIVKFHGYEPPNIVFLKKRFKEEVELEPHNGKYYGLCKDWKHVLPGYFSHKKFGDYHLVYLEGIYTHERDSSEDWDDKFPHPLCATTVHEIGHVLYSYLPQKEKDEITDFFTRIDLSLAENVPGLSHPGHASNYSYNNYLIRPGMDKKKREKYAEEQAVEFFVRHVAELKNSDLKAHVKSMRIIRAMEKFKRRRFLSIK
jgi:hypothetical protein